MMEQLDFVSAEQDEKKLRDKANKNDVKQKVRRQTSSKASTAKRSAGRTPRSVPPRDGYQRLNVEIPKQVHKELKVQAIVEERSVTDIVLEAIGNYLEDKS